MDDNSIDRNSTPSEIERCIINKLQADLKTLTGTPIDLDAFKKALVTSLEGMLPKPMISVTSASIEGDTMVVNMTMPRWLAIEAGLVEPR
jgi:hypothetical protein